MVLFKVGNMRIGEVLRFAARHAEIIAEFLASGDQVIVLRRCLVELALNSNHRFYTLGKLHSC